MCSARAGPAAREGRDAVPLVLTPRDLPPWPVEVEGCTPDALAGASAREVARRPLRIGAHVARWGDCFRVEGRGDGEVRVAGSVPTVAGLGAGMAGGRLVIEGDAGPRVGAGMRGGECLVAGNAGPYAGAEMAGGVLRIFGDAGDGAGAAAPGGRRGMTGGLLFIAGRAGREAGSLLRRGTIVVRGPAGDAAGLNMIAGTIVLCAGAGRAPGMAMKRGTVVTFAPLEMLPTFRDAGVYRPLVLRLLLTRLRAAYGLPLDPRWADGAYRRYSGDFNELGKGEIWIWADSG
jgi:formylmethanofuran dehydrogenase subunit C